MSQMVASQSRTLANSPRDEEVFGSERESATVRSQSRKSAERDLVEHVIKVLVPRHVGNVPHFVMIEWSSTLLRQQRGQVRVRAGDHVGHNQLSAKSFDGGFACFYGSLDGRNVAAHHDRDVGRADLFFASERHV